MLNVLLALACRAGSGQLNVVRHLDAGTQWFALSSHSLYLDELTGKPSGYRQTIWRVDGSLARIAYEAPATLLPSADFGGAGYVVEGKKKDRYVLYVWKKGPDGRITYFETE